MFKANENPDGDQESFGYREALAEMIVQLTVAEQRRLEAERASRRAQRRRRPALLDERGLALAR